ncbi:MAG: radical SAM protein [Rhodocyclaceae bacterium]|nr:radical SAM protein [Rhodocyclaceae bacterium]
MATRTLPQLEMHVTHACNLACESCAHYSNQGHVGILDPGQAEEWLAAWSGRIAPAVFSLVGGEPSLNPRLGDFVPLVRRHWPDTLIRIVSNGWFLHRHPSLPRILREDGRAILYLSVPHGSPEYLERIRPFVELAEAWEREEGIRVGRYASHGRWTRRYRGFGADLEPYADGRPRQSWEHCVARDYPQLHAGRLWKCPAIAYLGMQEARFGLSEAWRPYLAYRGLDAACDDAALERFIAAEEEPVCGMCPAQPEPFVPPMPIRIVRRRDSDLMVG